MSSLFEKLGASILARMFEVAAHGLALVDINGNFLHVNARGCDILGYSYHAILQKNILATVAERQQHDAARWFNESLQRVIGTHDLTIARPDGKGGFSVLRQGGARAAGDWSYRAA